MVTFQRQALRRQQSTPAKGSTVNSLYTPYQYSRSVSVPSSSPYGKYVLPSKNNRKLFTNYMPSTASNKLGLSLLGVLILLPWIPYPFIKAGYTSAVARIESSQASRSKALSDLEATRTQIFSLEDEAKKAHEQAQHVYLDLRQAGKLASSGDYAEMERLENGMLRNIDKLQVWIQEESRFYLKEQYERGPYKVALDVDVGGKLETIVLKLVDNKAMPHAIHIFMDMVAEELWSGLSMHLEHGVYMAHPPSDRINPHVAKRIESNKMVFGESSSDEFVKYSICFNGMGPSFYISLQQEPRRIADACFGAVVEGQNLLEEKPAVVNILSTAKLATEKRSRVIPDLVQR